MKAYARLVGVERSLDGDQRFYVQWSLAEELNLALRQLSDLGCSVGEFSMTGNDRERDALGQSIVNRQVLIARLTAAKLLFELANADPPIRIGFKGPRVTE